MRKCVHISIAHVDKKKTHNQLVVDFLLFIYSGIALHFTNEINMCATMLYGDRMVKK